MWKKWFSIFSPGHYLTWCKYSTSGGSSRTLITSKRTRFPPPRIYHCISPFWYWRHVGPYLLPWRLVHQVVVEEDWQQTRREQHLCHWPGRDAGHQQGGHRCQGSAQPQKAPEIDQSKHKHTSSNSSNGYELRVFRFTWLNSTTYRLRLALLWTYSMDVSYRFDWGILGTKLCEDHDGWLL